MSSVIKEIKTDINSIIEGIVSLKNYKSSNDYKKSISDIEELEDKISEVIIE